MYNAATNCSTIFEKDIGKVVVMYKPLQYTEVGYLLLLFVVVVVVVVIKSRASKARTGVAGEL